MPTRTIKSDVGTSLLELMLAIIMVVGGVMALAFFIPKSSATITNNRYQWLANNFASAKIQELKALPYNLIPLTDSSNFTLVTNPGGCDCSSSSVNLSGPQFVDATYVDSGVTYTRNVCIHLVTHDPLAGTWTSYCPDGTSGPGGVDQGLRRIHVRVTWTMGTKNYFVDSESLATR